MPGKQIAKVVALDFGLRLGGVCHGEKRTERLKGDFSIHFLRLKIASNLEGFFFCEKCFLMIEGLCFNPSNAMLQIRAS